MMRLDVILQSQKISWTSAKAAAHNRMPYPNHISDDEFVAFIKCAREAGLCNQITEDNIANIDTLKKWYEGTHLPSHGEKRKAMDRILAL